jgi:NAD(P)-dependent dehydrogenase (short-subunit alcohol dehydrogenase family)
MSDTLSQKTAVITGATSGIGWAAAGQLANLGWFVIGIGRSQERCDAAQSQVQLLSPSGLGTYIIADLSEQSQVRAAATQVGEILDQAGIAGLDALLNNAGAFYFWLDLTSEGFEKQWATNHLAPFLLTHRLLPRLKAAPSARVVMTSSMSHYKTTLNWEDIQLRRKYNGMRAYQQTKLANVLFTAEINRQVGGTVKAFAADPGLVDTGIGSKSDALLARWFWNWRRRKGISAEESAKGLVFLASEPSIQGSSEIYWKHSMPKVPKPYALDPENGKRLWALSEKMCGIPAGDYAK